MNWLLEVDCVGKRFAGRSVLTSASLWAPRGAVTFLVGRGGMGKSTLLRIATGILSADSGYVRFDGVTHLRPRLHRLAQCGLFYLPDRDLLSDVFTLWQHLNAVRCRIGASEGGLSEQQAAERLGVGHLVDRTPGSLSSGERRRAELALVLARNPRCLLADEPFRHLAPLDADVVGAALRFLAARGCAVVVTGHEVRSLFEVADRVTWCTSGTTYDLGTVVDARAHLHFCRDYLGTLPQSVDGGTPADGTRTSGAEPRAARD
jgi:ABC-type multidrug transport system ATPase subunit